MKRSTYMLLYSIFSRSVTSMAPLTPKLCKNCRHFLKPLVTPIEFGKCAMLLQPKDDINYFITGKRKNKSEHYFCSVARQSDYLCGEEGKYYEDKCPPISMVNNVSPTPTLHR